MQPNGNGVVASADAKRKRRGFGLARSERATSNRECFIQGRFLRSQCGLCIIRDIITFTITAEFFYDGIEQTITFTVKIITGFISIPATLSSSSSTTVSSSANANVTTAAATTTAALG